MGFGFWVIVMGFPPNQQTADGGGIVVMVMVVQCNQKVDESEIVKSKGYLSTKWPRYFILLKYSFPKYRAKCVVLQSIAVEV